MLNLLTAEQSLLVQEVFDILELGDGGLVVLVDLEGSLE